jgi:hypothetical protein
MWRAGNKSPKREWTTSASSSLLLTKKKRKWTKRFNFGMCGQRGGGGFSLFPLSRPTITNMNDTIREVNESLTYAEATIGAILVSCRDWLDSEIKESGEDFVKGIKSRIITRHPSMGWMVDPLEF